MFTRPSSRSGHPFCARYRRTPAVRWQAVGLEKRYSAAFATGLAPITSDLVILAEGYDISHGDLVRRILRTALERVGLAGSESRPA